jgi:hypothetical protein
MKVTLWLQEPDGARREVSLTSRIPEGQKVEPGMMLPVVIDPSDPKKVYPANADAMKRIQLTGSREQRRRMKKQRCNGRDQEQGLEEPHEDSEDIRREREHAREAIEQLERRGAVNTAKVDDVVREILAAVRERGDAALRDTRRSSTAGRRAAAAVSREEMQAAWDETSEELKAAMRLAQANIRAFAEKQLPRAWSFRPSAGMEVGQIVRPLEQRGLLCCRAAAIRCLPRC